MNVELIACTPGAEEVCAMAANGCYSPYPASDIVLNDEQINKILKRCIKSGHHSVLEHANYTFSVSNVSRVLTHQLIRHRVASFSQMSQRYVNMDECGYFTPQTVIDKAHSTDDYDVKIGKVYSTAMDYAFNTYSQLIESGIPEEDARYVLPNGCFTNITFTMNARELLHFFELRCCNRAQTEIREMAWKMLAICKERSPIIFEKAGPSCIRGKCTEEKPCGHPYKEM